jgi:hypothetical protein
MKHLFLIIGFLAVQTLSAQLILNLGKNVYYKAKVELEDGTIKDGYILKFDDRDVFYYNYAAYESLFASPEHVDGLTRNDYVFRNDAKGKDENLKMNDIKRITVEKPFLTTDEIDVQVYEKVKIAKPNNDLGIDVWENEVLLPVQYSNSKITIYNYTKVTCTGNALKSCFASGYNYYFLPTGAEYAVKPFEITASTIFSIKKIGPKVFASLEYMGQNCPTYLEHLASRKSKYTEDFGGDLSKEYNKIYKEEIAAYKDDLKKARKSMSKEAYKNYEIEQKRKQISEQNERFYNAMFNEEIIDYINSCE